MNRFLNFVARCSQGLAIVGVALMFALVVQVGFRSVTMERTGSWKSSERGYPPRLENRLPQSV